MGVVSPVADVLTREVSEGESAVEEMRGGGSVDRQRAEGMSLQRLFPCLNPSCLL